MLKKLLNITAQSPSSRSIRELQMQRLLAQIALEPPEFQWIVLVETNGLSIGAFPDRPVRQEDRAAAMSAAMLALGERITKELNNGAFRYSLIAGEEGKTLAITLSKNYLLTLGLNRDTTLDAVFEKLRGALTPLLLMLQIDHPTLF